MRRLTCSAPSRTAARQHTFHQLDLIAPPLLVVRPHLRADTTGIASVAATAARKSSLHSYPSGLSAHRMPAYLRLVHDPQDVLGLALPDHRGVDDALTSARARWVAIEIDPARPFDVTQDLRDTPRQRLFLTALAVGDQLPTPPQIPIAAAGVCTDGQHGRGAVGGLQRASRCRCRLELRTRSSARRRRADGLDRTGRRGSRSRGRRAHAPVRTASPRPVLDLDVRDRRGHREHQHRRGGQAPGRRHASSARPADRRRSRPRTNGNARSGVGGVHALSVVRVPRRPVSSSGTRRRPAGERPWPRVRRPPCRRRDIQPAVPCHTSHPRSSQHAVIGGPRPPPVIRCRSQPSFGAGPNTCSTPRSCSCLRSTVRPW